MLETKTLNDDGLVWVREDARRAYWSGAPCIVPTYIGFLRLVAITWRAAWHAAELEDLIGDARNPA